MKNSSAVKGMGQVIGYPNNFSSSEKTKSLLRPLVEVMKKMSHSHMDCYGECAVEYAAIRRT
jgi:hypothetical protein